MAYQFDRKGEVTLAASASEEDAIMEAAIIAGADDVQSDEFEHVVYTQPTLLAPVAEQLRARGFVLTSEKFTSIPRTPVVIEDLATAKQVLKLHDQLDAYDDTLNVFTNFELSDIVIDQLDS